MLTGELFRSVAVVVAGLARASVQFRRAAHIQPMEQTVKEIIEESRVVAFYYHEIIGCHVSELECGVNVLHPF